MTESRDRSAPSRREFLRLAAAAGIAGALVPDAAAFAQSSTPPPAAPPAPPAPEGPSEAAKALAAVLKERLGKDRLTEAQWESVAKDFDGDLSLGRRFSAIKLANGDEPDFVFFAARD